MQLSGLDHTKHDAGEIRLLGYGFSHSTYIITVLRSRIKRRSGAAHELAFGFLFSDMLSAAVMTQPGASSGTFRDQASAAAFRTISRQPSAGPRPPGQGCPPWMIRLFGRNKSIFGSH